MFNFYKCSTCYCNLQGKKDDSGAIRFHGENDARIVLGVIFNEKFDKCSGGESHNTALSDGEIETIHKAMKEAGINCNTVGHHGGVRHSEGCEAKAYNMRLTFGPMLGEGSSFWNYINKGVDQARDLVGTVPTGSGIEKVELSGVSKAKGLAVGSSKGNEGAASRRESYINELLSKDGKANYGDQRLTGVLYAWGNINVDIGESQLDVRGSMISYGGDPSNPDQKLEFNLIKAESPVKRFYQAERDKKDHSLPEKYSSGWSWRPSSTAHLNRWCGDGTSTSTEKSEGGNINIAQAGEVDLTFDPSYLNNFGGISTNKKVTISLYTNR